MDRWQRAWKGLGWLKMACSELSVHKGGACQVSLCLTFVRKRNCTKAFFLLTRSFPHSQFPTSFPPTSFTFTTPENPHPVHKFTKRANHAIGLWHSQRHPDKKNRFPSQESRHNCFYKIFKYFVWKGVWRQQCNEQMYTMNITMTHCRLVKLRNKLTKQTAF